MTDPLTEFLLDRIAEDEALYRGALHMGCVEDIADGPNVIHSATCPNRVLAECKAKRAIVETYRDERSRRDAYQTPEARAVESMSQRDMRRSSAARCRGLEIAVEFLAEAYADHPDYPQVRTCPKCGADCDMRVQVCECGPDCPLTPVHR